MLLDHASPPRLRSFVSRAQEKELPLGPVIIHLVGPGPSLTAAEIFLDPSCVI